MGTHISEKHAPSITSVLQTQNLGQLCIRLAPICQHHNPCLNTVQSQSQHTWLIWPNKTTKNIWSTNTGIYFSMWTTNLIPGTYKVPVIKTQKWPQKVQPGRVYFLKKYTHILEAQHSFNDCGRVSFHRALMWSPSFKTFGSLCVSNMQCHAQNAKCHKSALMQLTYAHRVMFTQEEPMKA
jgi:hypothetical protein